MLVPHFHPARRDSPKPLVEIDLGPDHAANLARSRRGEDCKFKGLGARAVALAQICEPWRGVIERDSWMIAGLRDFGRLSQHFRNIALPPRRVFARPVTRHGRP